MTFTEKLNYLMEQKGIKNRSQLSKLSGIPYTTIVGFFEKGTENIRRTTLIKLSDFFDCSLEYLVSDEIHDENYGKSIGFNINSSEILHLQKYRALDEHGKRIIDFNLNEEYERCTAVPEEIKPEIVHIKLAQLPASAGTGVDLYEENYEIMSVRACDLTKQADFAVRVSGDSMESTFFDGDILLIESMPYINVGDIGIFVVNGDGFVKEYGGDRLISHNDKYPDIKLTEHDVVICSGRVIGALEESDFVD